MQVFKASLIVQVFLFFLLSPVSCWTGHRSSRNGSQQASSSSSFKPSNNNNYYFNNRELSSELYYRRSEGITSLDYAPAPSLRTSSKLEAACSVTTTSSSEVVVVAVSPPKPMELPAKQASQMAEADALLDAEIAIGRIFMAAALVLMASEWFTDLSVSQLLTTMFVSQH
jgi:hypothetical protein